MKKTDVCIAGGGPAGVLLSLLLARNPFIRALFPYILPAVLNLPQARRFQRRLALLEEPFAINIKKA